MKQLIEKIKHLRFGKSYQLLLIGLLFVSLVGFVEKRQNLRKCKNVSVYIDNRYDNYFVAKEDVYNLMSQKDRDILKGAFLGTIDLKSLEQRIETHQFVNTAEVFYNLGGDLKVEVTQKKPIARVSQRNKEDFYLDSKGEVLPMSNRFTARVMLVDGAFVKNFTTKDWNSNDTLKPYIDFVQYVNNHDFFRSMITQIIIDKKGNINIYPQMGKYIIEFGKPEHFEDRFRKFKILYKRIFPKKGWDKYQYASLKYEDQIICD